MLGLAVVLLGVVSFLQLGIEFNFAIAILGILLEALLLVSVALFFGTFARPMMTAVFSVALFVIGHWISSLEYFIDHSKDPLFKGLAFVISRVVPDFERFNWRSAPVYGLSVPCADVGFALVYAAGWIIVLLTATSIIFRRRDFV
jgi:ABC-type transport system involved in multi-copper enzyme maturation permease subunit